MRPRTALVLLLLLASATLCMAASDDIVGVWYDQVKDAKIDVFKCGDKYCGKLVWLREPNYPPGSKEGTPGTPKLDNNNPDPALRKAPRLGLEIVKDFQFAGDSLWKNGTVYDPKSGKTYSGKITMVSPKELHLRGFVGISMFGRTEIWTRAD